MRRDTGTTSGQGTAARRGHRGQPVCTDLTSDPMQRSNSASATVALWESGWRLSPAGVKGPGAVQHKAISPVTRSPADDGFDQWTRWRFEHFLRENISRLRSRSVFPKGNILTYKELWQTSNVVDAVINCKKNSTKNKSFETSSMVSVESLIYLWVLQDSRLVAVKHK